MKTRSPFVPGLIALLLPFFFYAQNCPPDNGRDAGQQLKVKHRGVSLGTGTASSLATISGNINAPFQFELFDRDTTVPNNDCRDTLCNVCGWYKGFWIFGDGNFIKYGNDISHMDTASLKASYKYSRTGTYQPVVYLTERYHNDQKPDAARIQINVTGTPATPATDSPVLLAANETAEIVYNHELRKEFPTVFVLSQKKQPAVSRVLFFYNALFSAEDNTTRPRQLMTFDKTEVPAYLRAALNEPLPYNLRNPDFFNRFNAPFFTYWGNQFGNCKEYGIDSGKIDKDQTNGLNELRLFPVMNVDDFPPNQVPTLPGRVVSVVLGYQPLSGEALRQLRDQLYTLIPDSIDLGDDLKVYDIVSDGNDGQGTAEYIIGIADQKIPVVASHDPNNLFITKIDTLTGGRYNVSFSLRICNQGENTEENPSIAFHDLTGGHYSAQPQLIDLPNDVTVTWFTTGRSDSVSLAGFSINGVPVNYAPKCRFVHFSIETDQTGVDWLKKEDPRALEVCVTFSGATGGQDCSVNDVLKDGDLNNHREIPKSNDCWILFFLALIVLILIIYFWKQNQQPS